MCVYTDINKKVPGKGQRLNKAEHIREGDGTLWVSTAHIFHHLLSVTGFLIFWMSQKLNYAA